jgi:hypothetical protein
VPPEVLGSAALLVSTDASQPTAAPKMTPKTAFSLNIPDACRSLKSRITADVLMPNFLLVMRKSERRKYEIYRLLVPPATVWRSGSG